MNAWMDWTIFPQFQSENKTSSRKLIPVYMSTKCIQMMVYMKSTIDLKFYSINIIISAKEASSKI